MRIRLKLSIPHDMDLITLSQCQFPITEWIKIALKSYAEDKRLAVIPLPEMPQEIRYEKCELNFSLHETRDKSVIDWLNTLRAGQRSGAIKSIFRCSLSSPCLAGHVADGTAENAITPKSIPSVSPSLSRTPKKKTEKKPTYTPPPVFTEPDTDDDFDIFGFNPDR